jgi:membrane protein
VNLPGWITRTRDAAEARWHDVGERYFWLKHIVLAWNRFSDNNGNHFAAAITYFSFLALFPTVLLAAAVLGFVLRHNPHLQQDLLDHITSGLPGGFGQLVKDSINAAVRERTGVGVVGLAGLLLTGLGWVGNLRAAINAVWGVEPPKKNFFQAKAANLVVLAGLGLGILISIGLTVVGTSYTGKILRAVGADDVPGIHNVLTISGIVLALLGDLLIFSWVLVRLPRASLPARVVFMGALLAAVGFEILKVVGTYYIARITRSPTVGVFGSVIGVLVWIDLVSRFLLYSAAWTATALPPPTATPAPIDPEPGVGPDRPAMSPLRVAGSLFGAGAAVGGSAVAAFSARRRRRAGRRPDGRRAGR